MDFARGERACYRFTFGIACYPHGCQYVYDHVPVGYHPHIKRQRREARTPSDDPTTLNRARKELATLRIIYYGCGSQQSEAIGGSADHNKLPTRTAFTPTLIAATATRKAQTSSYRPSRPSTERSPCGQWSHPTPRPGVTPARPTPPRPDGWSTNCGRRIQYGIPETVAIASPCSAH